MNITPLSRLATGFVAALCITVVSSATAQTKKDMPRMSSAMPMGDRASIDRVIAAWAERPRLGAVEMMAKYGLPQEVTAERLIWRNPGPFKRITVFNLETPHDFPLPHVDFLEHTISYDVPQAKVGDLVAFDGSSTINRTVGELSARCDLEGHNVLTLNLDHDIVTGKKTVEQARMAFGEIVGKDVRGEHPPYVEGLQFKPHTMAMAAFSDKPVIPGSPVRASDMKDAPTANARTEADDAEVLATVVAVDLNEVLAASQAQMEKVSAPVMDYAKMLHQMHGMSMGETLKLGEQIGVTPVITPKVEALQKKGAGELAALVPLDGKAFEHAYVDAMVKGHAEVLAMIDGQLLKAADNAEVKAHLTKTRAAVADHLAKAKALQSGMSR